MSLMSDTIFYLILLLSILVAGGSLISTYQLFRAVYLANKKDNK
jgi:hypothetical protein